MKHYIQFTIACLLLLTCPTATMAEQEKKQNYIYLSGETKKIYKLHDVITGTAAWYGERLHGNKTSSGERFDCNKLTAAHRSLPFGTILIVTNLFSSQIEM